MTKNKDKIAVKRVLGLLGPSVKNHPFEDVFLHSLITFLIQMRDEFDAEDFCTVVFDEFFLALIANDNVVRHLLRLLKFVHTKVSSTRLENLMKLTEPTVAASSSSTSGLPSSMAMLGSSGNVFQARLKVQNFFGATHFCLYFGQFLSDFQNSFFL